VPVVSSGDCLLGVAGASVVIGVQLVLAASGQPEPAAWVTVVGSVRRAVKEHRLAFHYVHPGDALACGKVY
jgi:hypothetical protein